MKKTIRNQWYMVKFCMEASPLHFLYHIVICVGLEIFIFLEHTVWIGYNLDAAEQNRDFSRVLVMTVGMVVLLAFHHYAAPSISTGQRRRSSRCCIRSCRRAFMEKPKLWTLPAMMTRSIIMSLYCLQRRRISALTVSMMIATV